MVWVKVSHLRVFGKHPGGMWGATLESWGALFLMSRSVRSQKPAEAPGPSRKPLLRGAHPLSGQVVMRKHNLPGPH